MFQLLFNFLYSYEYIKYIANVFKYFFILFEIEESYLYYHFMNGFH